MQLFIALALGTGARSRSILELTWGRVDFDHSRIDFQEPGRPVTKKRRSIVPMNSQVRSLLTEAQAAAQCDYVVEWEGKPIKSGIRWPFAKAARRANLPSNVTPHVLKHTAASWLAMEGIPLSQAADMLATDEATLRRVYRKFDPEYLAPAAGALVF